MSPGSLGIMEWSSFVIDLGFETNQLRWTFYSCLC